jgi:hypothetical protein
MLRKTESHRLNRESFRIGGEMARFVMRRVRATTTFALTTVAVLSVAVRGGDDREQSQIRATKPPEVLVENSCGYGDQNDAYGSLALLVAIPVTEAIDGVARDKPQWILYSLHCGMSAQAVVNTSYVCKGAYLELDSLINGKPLTSATHLGPIAADWNNLEFRVVERTGPLFRLSSRWVDPLFHGHLAQATISADLAVGRVSYVRHEEAPGKLWDARGDARCVVTGWTPRGPAKPYWKK